MVVKNFSKNMIIKFLIKKRIINLLYIILVVLCLWTAITNIIQAFKCPRMTQTELFLHIPKSFICDWEICD